MSKKKEYFLNLYIITKIKNNQNKIQILKTHLAVFVLLEVLLIVLIV